MNNENTTPAEHPFWRDVTDNDVRNAISGSILDAIYRAYAKNYTPRAPLPLILLQGILLTSVALTHKADPCGVQLELWSDDDTLAAEPDTDPEYEIAPAHQSRLWINTGLGNVPNAYVLIVAPSGAGKGMGQLQMVKRLGYTELSSCSLEGVKDAAMLNPHLLISLQEFGSVLAGKGYKDDVKRGLTDMFNAGRFTDALSARNSKVVRSVSWFYPSIYASVQPEVLKAAGRNQDIAQGFFSRFLIGYVSPSDAAYEFNPCNPDILNDLTQIQRSLSIISRLSGIVKIPDPHYNSKFANPVRAVINERMLPVLQRYANEYLPRIALMLALPAQIPQSLELPELTEEHFARATVVMHRILTMAEEALGSLTDLAGRARLQEENLTKMVKLLHRLSLKKPTITISEISRNSCDSGWNSKIRRDLLDELIQRHWIEVRDRMSAVSEKVDKGCEIKLKNENIPPGIL